MQMQILYGVIALGIFCTSPAIGMGQWMHVLPSLKIKRISHQQLMKDFKKKYEHTHFITYHTAKSGQRTLLRTTLEQAALRKELDMFVMHNQLKASVLYSSHKSAYQQTLDILEEEYRNRAGVNHIDKDFMLEELGQLPVIKHRVEMKSSLEDALQNCCDTSGFYLNDFNRLVEDEYGIPMEGVNDILFQPLPMLMALAIPHSQTDQFLYPSHGEYGHPISLPDGNHLDTLSLERVDQAFEYARLVEESLQNKLHKEYQLCMPPAALHAHDIHMVACVYASSMVYGKILCTALKGIDDACNACGNYVHHLNGAHAHIAYRDQYRQIS